MERKLPHIYTCFPGGTHKVLTFSFDDGKQEDKRLVALFNQYGVKGTFNLNAGIDHDEKRIPLTEYKDLYQGHEIASHTYTHPTIARCPITTIATQILEDRKVLENLVGYPVQGLAYPNGSYSDEIKQLLPMLGIKYARIVGNSDGFALPNDVYEWKSTCHFKHNLLELGEQFINLHKKQYLYMMYVWGHSYELATEEDWTKMEEFCKLVSNKDDTWYATNIDYVNYMEDAKRLVFTADLHYVYNPNARAIWISYNDDRFVEIPAGTQIQLV